MKGTWPRIAAVTLMLSSGCERPKPVPVEWARVQGTVLLPAGIEPDDVQLALVAAGEKPASRPEEVIPPDDDGTFLVGAPVDGSYDLSVWVGSEQFSPAVLVEGLSLRSNETARDPRLESLDLRKHMHLLRVRARDPTGREVSAVDLDIYPVVRGHAEVSDLDLVFSWEREREVVVSQLPVDLYVAAPGCRTQFVQGMAEDVEVALEGGIPVKLALEGLPKELPDGADVLVHLFPRDAPQKWSTGIEVVVDEGISENVFYAPHPGRYFVSFQPLKIRSLGPFQKEWRGEPVRMPILEIETGESEIEITDADEEQRIVFKVPPQVVGALIEGSR